MDKSAYDAIRVQSDWHEDALRALLVREGRRQEMDAAIDTAYFGVLTAVFSLIGTMGSGTSSAMAWGACWFAGGVSLGRIVVALVHRSLGTPTAPNLEADFGIAVRVYLARKLQGAGHGIGAEGNIADAERARRRLGLPDIPMEGEQP